jgi:hypothetical protein
MANDTTPTKTLGQIACEWSGVDYGTPWPINPPTTKAWEAAAQAVRAAVLAAPIDMVLFCPKCGCQHVDAPEEATHRGLVTMPEFEAWDNPPHKSHLCHGCGHIWRPADVPTNGVVAVKTKGTADSPLAKPSK